MNAPLPKYRKPRPDQAPSATDIDDAERWTRLADTSLSATQEAAEKWRTGLAAFVALIAGGFLLKGPEAAQQIDRGWLVALTILAATGFACAVAGLWLSLRAAAGSPARANLATIVEQYGGVRQFEIAAAAAASKKLSDARTLVAVALVLLGGFTIAWWWTPTPDEKPAAYVRVEHAGDVTCGTLLSSDNARLRIEVDGEETRTAVPFADVINLRVVASC